MIRSRRARIVATLGPASRDPERVLALAIAGADVFRLNFSHGSAQDHIDRAALVREIAGLRVGTSNDPDAHYGPLVTAAHRSRVEAYIAMAVEEGAELVVDGRGFAVDIRIGMMRFDKSDMIEKKFVANAACFSSLG